MLPALDGASAVLLPLEVPVAIASVEGAAQQLEAACLALLVEAMALRPLADVGQPAALAASAWSDPVLVAQPASYPHEAAQPVYSAPIEVRGFSVQDASQVPAPSASLAEAPFTASELETPRKAYERTYVCKKCGAGPFSFADLCRHSRQCKSPPTRPGTI